jgi:uncharacterized membrane protein
MIAIGIYFLRAKTKFSKTIEDQEAVVFLMMGLFAVSTVIFERVNDQEHPPMVFAIFYFVVGSQFTLMRQAIRYKNELVKNQQESVE